MFLARKQYKVRLLDKREDELLDRQNREKIQRDLLRILTTKTQIDTYVKNLKFYDF